MLKLALTIRQISQRHARGLKSLAQLEFGVYVLHTLSTVQEEVPIKRIAITGFGFSVCPAQTFVR